MVKMTQSLQQWLWNKDPKEFAYILMGHIERFTPEMSEEYLAWCQTDEGKSYLVGGSNYVKEYNE